MNFLEFILSAVALCPSPNPNITPDPLTAVQFRFYYGSTTDTYEEHNLGDIQNLFREDGSGRYSINKPTVLYIPPYCQNIDTTPIAEAEPIPALVETNRGRYNFIVVKWFAFGSGPYYGWAAPNALIVGEAIADEFIKNPHSPHSIEVIGFSLGAQVAATIAKKLKPTGKITRVIGLDPAGPLFTNCPYNGNLVRYEGISRYDAPTVVILITSLNTISYYKEDLVNMGTHVFLFNYIDWLPDIFQTTQPYCKNNFITDFGKVINTRDLKDTLQGCGHYMTSLYYAEAVRNPLAFIATERQMYKSWYGCRTSTYVSYVPPLTTNTKPGIYALKTNDRPPFGLGEKGRCLFP